MTHNQLRLHDKVVQVTYIYLGPAADRFIARHIENHLHKPPDKLTQADLSELIDWIQAAVSLLTEDEEMIEEYITKLKALAGNSAKLRPKVRT